VDAGLFPVPPGFLGLGPMNVDAVSLGAPHAADDAKQNRRGLAFFAVCLGNFIVFIDTSIVNLALPHVHASLHGSLAGLVWVANGYTLAMAALVLNGGAIGDRLGNDRAYWLGALGFAVTSLSCGLAPTLPALIALRACQGACGALLLPALLGLIPHLYPDKARRARAVTIWASTGAVALATGPLLAGVLIDSVGWRAIFYINVPICVAAALIVRWTLNDVPRHRSSASLDLTGQVLVVAGLAAFSFAIVEGPSFGWGSAAIVASIVVALVAGVAFVLAERRGASPLLPPRLFANRTFTAAVSAGVLFQLVFFGALFIFPLYLQDVHHATALAAGLELLPLTCTTALSPTLITNRIVARHGFARSVLVGSLAGVPGCLLILFAPTPYWLLGIGMGLMGVWSGLTLPPTVSLAVTNTPAEFSGTGSGVLNAGRQIGAVLGVSVLGTLIGTSSVASGLRVGMVIFAAGMAGIAVLISLGTRDQTPSPD
jgi:MFS transporter, DHA2 family, methylenomycin A resistance protein